MNIGAIVESNEALVSVENAHEINTRHTGFALNQSKQIKNLRRDAVIENYDTVINNHDENLNAKCSSGFYLEVASPALLSLAKQTCDASLVINDVGIKCLNSRISLDSHNLLVNSTFFFDLLDTASGESLGKVTIHCHVTTKVVQLQGSKLISGSKAPVWFFNNVLKNTFERESSERSTEIEKVNNEACKLTSDDLKCNHCEKKYKTATGLQKHLQTKHDSLIFQTDERNLRKRRNPDFSELEYCPPTKTLALGSPCPTAVPTPSPPTTVTPAMFSVASPPQTSLNLLASELPAPALSSTVAPPLLLSSVTSSATRPVPIAIQLNLDAEPYFPPPWPPFPQHLPVTDAQESYNVQPPPVPHNQHPDLSPLSSCSSVTSDQPPPSLPTTSFSSTAAVSSAPAPPPVKPKERLRKCKTKTLALTPEEFEKENLKVERDACRAELTKIATEKKDLDETVEILTTRCRLLEEERSKAATKLAAPKALHVPNPVSPEPAPIGSSSLETLINLEVLKAVKAFSPTSVPPPTAPCDPPTPSDASEKHLKDINETLQTIIDNQKFLYERIEIIISTVNYVARSNTDGCPPKTNSATKAPTSSSSTQTCPDQQPYYPPPPPPSPFPPPPPPPPPPMYQQPLIPQPGVRPPVKPNAQSQTSSQSSACPSPPASAPPPPPGRPGQHASASCSYSSTSDEPAVPIPSLVPRRRSLLGPPPMIKRTPGSPKPLSVMFCNQHGRPEKLSLRSPASRSPRITTKRFSTRVFTNSSKEFSRCSPDEIKLFSTGRNTAKDVISEILSNVIESIIQNEPDDNISPNSDALHESVISLDNSDVTNILGEPFLDEKTTKQSLNC